MKTAGLWLGRAGRRIGRRGATLLFVGLLGAVLAASLCFIPPDQAATPAYVMLAQLMPLQAWGVLWGLLAGVCWVQAFMRQDRVAFAASTLMWWMFGVAYILGFLTGVNDRGWVGGGIWILFGAWLNLIATWPEASTPPPDAKATLRRPGDAIITADSSGVVRSWNAAAETMFGWSAPEMVARQSVHVIIPADLRAAHEEAMVLARVRGHLTSTGGRVLNTRALHRDGTVFPVETTLGMAQAGGGTTFSAVIRRLDAEEV